ncbi:MAG: ABC transporter ATP-binding protein/permease [Oscillospiraceae bacterium]|nr:ABC transporter ATP-binding protein/permease [Oscillospiraceae bacterium]
MSEKTENTEQTESTESTESTEATETAETTETKDKKTTQSLASTIKVSRYVLGLVKRQPGGKLFLFVRVIMAIKDALFPLVTTIFPGLIINELIGEARTEVLAVLVGVLVGTPLVGQVFNFFAHRYKQRKWNEIQVNIQCKFRFHNVSMDYENIERPTYNTMIDRIEDTFWRLDNYVSQMLRIVTAILGMVAVASIIAVLNPLIIVLISVMILVNALFTNRANKKSYELGKESSKEDNRGWAYREMLTWRGYAKDLRLYNIENLLIESYTGQIKKVNKLRDKNYVINNVPHNISAITNMLQQGAIYAYLIYSVVAGNIEIGTMTIFLAATAQFFSSFSSLSQNYLYLAGNNMQIGEMIEFFALPRKQMETGNKTPTFDRNSTIEFRGVSFKYPGSETYALKNMNITFRGDEKLCIVGANGSGKSTFVALLTRLYWPTEGEILLNGVNIYEYDYKQYQRLFAPVFQDTYSFYFNLGKNVTLASEFDQAKLDDVSAKSGLKILVDKLPKGYDTNIHKWLDEEGIEPSGGEAQKLYMARAVYHGAPVFLLDEPTAALDPVAEYEIYTKFNEMIADRGAILITHRLSAVQLADKVAVFEAGAVVEYGTHKELYKAGGTYTEMYDKQAEFYKG